MAQAFDPAEYAPAATAAIGLPLPPEDISGVIAAFAVIARVAAPLMAFALPEDIVAAAVFTPDDGSAS